MSCSSAYRWSLGVVGLAVSQSVWIRWRTPKVDHMDAMLQCLDFG